MQIDVAESLRRVLDKRQSVCIDGIGTFKLINISATFGEERKSILPPSVDIEFDTAISSNASLVEFITDKYDISDIKAEKAINIFNKRIFNGLFNYGKVNIQGLGILENAANGKTEFTSDPAFVSQYYKNLPEVPIKFIVRDDKIEKRISTPAKKLVSTQPKSFDSLLDKIQSTEIEKAEIQKTEIKKAEIQKAEIEKAEIKKDNTRVNVIAPLPEAFPLKENEVPNQMVWGEEKKKKKSYWLPALLGIATILLLFSGIKTCQWIKGNKSEATNSIVENEAVGEDKAEELALLTENIGEDESAVLPTECKIITGVFATQENIDRMVTKLEANGYVPYLEPFGPYTRTGIRFACNDMDLESYIQSVRQSVEANAWYLDPQIHVPY